MGAGLCRQSTGPWLGHPEADAAWWPRTKAKAASPQQKRSGTAALLCPTEPQPHAPRQPPRAAPLPLPQALLPARAPPAHKRSLRHSTAVGGTAHTWVLGRLLDPAAWAHSPSRGADTQPPPHGWQINRLRPLLPINCPNQSTCTMGGAAWLR